MSTISGAVLEDPLTQYSIMLSRLEQNGPCAGMPEFGGVVEAIAQKLEEDDIKSHVKESSSLWSLYESAQIQLFHLQLRFPPVTDKYPHEAPYKRPYPYMPTLTAITNSLTLLDAIQRSKYRGIPPLYHYDRYCCHSFQMYHSPNWDNGSMLYYPLLQELSLENLVATRSVPLGFVGVNTDVTFADGYYQSSLEYWAHDINHIRRMKSFNDMAYRQEKSVRQTIEKKHTFVNSVLLPALKIAEGDDEHETSIKQCMMLILFELFHEDALYPATDQIKAAFDHVPGDGTPYEMFTITDENGDMVDDRESRRLPNLTIESGWSYIKQNKLLGSPVTVARIMDSGPGTIPVTHDKLVNGHYTSRLIEAENSSSSLPPKHLRTPKIVGLAAHRLAGLFFGTDHPYSKEQLIKKAEGSANFSYRNDALELPTR